MSRSLVIPITMMILIATAMAMLASAMLLPTSDATPFTTASGADVVRRFYAAVNETIATGNAAALRRVVTQAFIDETPLPGVPPGRDGLEAYLATLHDADPGIRLEADVIISSADQVMTRIQVRQSEPPASLPASFGGSPAVWSPIEVFRVTDGVVVGRWGYTDGLTSARRLAEQPLALPIPTPRIVSLMRITLASGTRWDAPRVAGPRLFFTEAGVLKIQSVAGSPDESAQRSVSESLAEGGSGMDTADRTMLTAGKSWQASAGVLTSMVSVGSTAARVLVVTFSEPSIPNGVFPDVEQLSAGVTAQVLAGDLATNLGTGSVTVTIEQISFAPDAHLNLWSTDGPILVAVETGQLEAAAFGTAWVRMSRDGMSMASQANDLTPDKGLLLQPDGMVALRNGEQYSADALVVTIRRVSGSHAP